MSIFNLKIFNLIFNLFQKQETCMTELKYWVGPQIPEDTTEKCKQTFVANQYIEYLLCTGCLETKNK